MDDDAIVERMRAAAERFDNGHTDVEALIDRAVIEGRRHRTRRRVAGAVSCAVVA